MNRARRLLAFARAFAFVRGNRVRPARLTLAVTERCSCRCAVCSLWRAPRPGPSTAELERLFAANPRLVWLNLTGGEAAERPDFADIVRAAARHTAVALLDFPTAGQRPRLVEDAVRAALRQPFARVHVTVSLDGPPEVHDRLRGTSGAFEAATETWRRLRSIRDPRLRVHVGVTFSARNDEHPAALVAELLERVEGLSPRDLHFNVAHHAPHAYQNRPGVAPRAQPVADFLERWAGRTRRRLRDRFDPVLALERAYWRGVRTWLADARPPIPCLALLRTAFVDADLKLHPCIGWQRPIVDLRRVGYSLQRALALAEAARAREMAAEQRCPGCWTPCEAAPALLARALRPHTGRAEAIAPAPASSPLLGEAGR